MPGLVIRTAFKPIFVWACCVGELRRRAGRVFVASWAAEKNGEAGWSSCFQDFRARVVETLARHRHRLK
jgi:hypothetical protein